jgi:hypothetical protein
LRKFAIFAAEEYREFELLIALTRNVTIPTVRWNHCEVGTATRCTNPLLRTAVALNNNIEYQTSLSTAGDINPAVTVEREADWVTPYCSGHGPFIQHDRFLQLELKLCLKHRDSAAKSLG